MKSVLNDQIKSLLLDNNDNIKYQLIVLYIKDINEVSLGLLIELISYFKDDVLKYKVFQICYNKLEYSYTLLELKALLINFNSQELRYKLLCKLLNNSFLFEDNKIITDLFTARFWSKAIAVIDDYKKKINYLEIIKLIESCDNKLELLENAVKYSGLKLFDPSEHCEKLREMFHWKDYITACEILGINPDVYELFI